MKNVYITSIGAFLPNEPVGNDEMEDYLGKINGRDSLAKNRILKQNGITTRYYAIDKAQNSTHTNAQMAAEAVKSALKRGKLNGSEIEMLATGTTQGDLPVPGFASMVHALLPIPTCEVASFQSVCCAGMMALKDAYVQIRAGEKKAAVSVGSEFSSRLFKSSRFESQGIESLPFDAEFLRWMLSDGAGAMVLQNHKPDKGLCLRIHWIDIKSFAHEFPACMYTGKINNKDEHERTWLDYPNYEEASRAGALNLKQDIRLLDQVVKKGISHYFDVIDGGKIQLDEVDWWCCHYSSEFFKGSILDLMEKGGARMPEEKWFTNLTTKGNTGSASIYIMLEELFYSGKLQKGQKILCMVPESGRFTTAFMLLEVEGTEETRKSYEIRKIEAPELNLVKSEVSEWLVRRLASVWIDFEAKLLKVPIIEKIHTGGLTLSDYKLLLHDLRQQVIDGSQWITRAASNIDMILFDLRSAFIKHAATEHKDYQILEKNFVNLGEDHENILTEKKNIGSVALTSFMFQQASKSNPIDLLGAMFIIEGIGKRLAGYWGNLIKDQLQLEEDQVSFFTYHGVADENHFERLEKALNHPLMTLDIAENIVKTAKTTARLYAMQLEELGNY